MDCKWNNWSSWSCVDIEFVGCSVGQITRKRTVAVGANKWGKCVGEPIQFKEWCNVKCQCFAKIPIPPGNIGKTLRNKVTNFMKKIRCPIPPQGKVQTIHHCFTYRVHLKCGLKVIYNITITCISLIYLPGSAKKYPQVVVV